LHSDDGSILCSSRIVLLVVLVLVIGLFARVFDYEYDDEDDDDSRTAPSTRPGTGERDVVSLPLTSAFCFLLSTFCFSEYFLLSHFLLFRLNAGTWKPADNLEFQPGLHTRLPQRPGPRGSEDDPDP
jgi:hypothetical protein